MKKSILIVLFFIIIILSACTMDSGNRNTHSSNEHRPLHTYTDLAAYEAYISTTDQLTSDFISYGQLEMLGDFRRVLFGNKNTNGKYTTSNYAFTDRNGFSYSLNIKYEGEPYVLDRPIYEIINEMESMLDAQSNDKYAIIKNNKYYIYSGGVLSSICWYENNIRFQIGLCDYESSANYPLGGEITFITRILSLDDDVSGTAFAELSASINQ